MILGHNVFYGIAPTLTDSALPDGYAVEAKNVDLRKQYITPLKGTENVYTQLPTTAKYVYTPDNFVFLTSEQPLQAYQSPVIQDVYNRIYFTEGNRLRVTTKGALKTDGGPIDVSYVPGVPTPTVAIQVDKVRKNRWPGYPQTTLKGIFFIESNGQRYRETSVTLTQKPNTKAFTAYTFNVGFNYKQVVAEAAVTTGLYFPLVTDSVLSVDAVYLTQQTTQHGRTFAANQWELLSGQGIVSSSQLTVISDGNTYTFSLSTVKYVRTADGSVGTTTGSDITPEDVPQDAKPALELWLETTNNERIWTAFVNTVSAGFVSTVPGGISIALTPTGDTTFDVTLTFGVVEDRAYVYTLVNEWNEESAPSLPVNVSVTYLDDVILRVDVDKCISLFKDPLNNVVYCPYKNIQFYCAAKTGTYQAIATSPTGITVANSISVTDLYHAILGRDPDAEGLAYWTAMYDSGMDISEIAWNMFNSAEYKHYESGYIIEDLYYGLLDRAPDSTGYNYYRKEYENGASLKDIVWSFLVSTEFATKHPTLVRNTGADFINFVYTTFLNRSADAGALAAWLYNAPSNWDFWASYVIATVLTSEEYKSIVLEERVIDLLTVAYGRAPTSSEIADAIDKLQNGYSLASLLMKESSVTSDGFLDEGKRLGWELQSSEWNPPPPDLESLALLPNGVFAAIRGTEVWFSEPYLPFTWPTKYIQNTSYRLVAAEPYAGNLLLITTDKPIIVSGPHPGAMTQAIVNVVAPGISRKAVTSTNNTPIFATPEGLFQVDGLQGSYELSKSFWSFDVWKELYGSKLDQLTLAYFDGKLIGSFETGDGFIIDLSAKVPTLVTHSINGYSFFNVPKENSLFIVTSSGCKKLFSQNYLSYSWKSKNYVFNKPSPLTAGMLFHRGTVTLKVYTNKGLKLTKTFTSTDSSLVKSFFRLPAGERYAQFWFELSSTTGAVVERIHFASTGVELGNV